MKQNTSKMIVFLMALFMCCLLAIPTVAATEEPVITLQPQSPNYPEYSVAIYTVKAEGTNLQATWYMDWLGKTYTISSVGGAMQDWEPYAGESYGARKVDDSTFIYVFEGIEYDLDGAYIWCVIEDGHYSVTSQKNRISVGNDNMPPEILSIPSELTVEQGDLAEIRCVAKTSDGSELSFLWYETDTGKREDIRAVNRGEETSDFLICDTDTVGTRNYICMVASVNGGMTYSSVVPVTVTEKQTVDSPDEPSEPEKPTGDPTEKPTEQPAEKPAEKPTEDPIEKPTEKPTEQPTEQPTVKPTEQPTDPTENKVSVNPTANSPKEQTTSEGFPWWGIVLIAVAASAVGFVVALIVMKKKTSS